MPCPMSSCGLQMARSKPVCDLCKNCTWAIGTVCTEMIKSVLCQASLCWRLCGSFIFIISTVHPFLHCTPMYPYNPHLISTGHILHKLCIHIKSEKVCEVCFSATKKLREKCVNLDIKILQQKCVNY